MSDRSKGRRGFTLIEILMVLAIIGMIAGIAIVAVVNTGKGARIDATKAKLKAIETAIETYNLHIGHYPTEEEGGLKALLEKPAFTNEALAEKWRGPYLKQEARDEWSNLYNYQVNPTASTDPSAPPYRLWSNGPDGMDNNGEPDDIPNWTTQTGSSP